MQWWTYYLFWMVVPALFALGSRHPAALALVVVALILRRWLPDPVLFVKYLGRVSSLRAQIEVNPHNATAKRELAMIFLEKRRPRRAAPLLEQALERDAESAELHYLLGVARLRSGEPERALESLGEALRLEEKVRYGDAYLRAGEAFAAAGKLDESAEAYRRFLAINRSSLEGMFGLAKVHERRGDKTSSRQALDEAVQTYRQIPAFLRRRQLGWYLRAQLARLLG